LIVRDVSDTVAFVDGPDYIAVRAGRGGRTKDHLSPAAHSKPVLPPSPEAWIYSGMALRVELLQQSLPQ
ncbi:hypothetical protein M9458_004172, partial [Cirrhinus mrigala]